MMPGEELDCQELELYKVDDVLYVGTRYAQALTEHQVCAHPITMFLMLLHHFISALKMLMLSKCKGIV